MSSFFSRSSKAKSPPLLPDEGVQALHILVGLGQEGLSRLIKGIRDVGPRLSPPDVKAILLQRRVGDLLALEQIEDLYQSFLIPLQGVAQEFSLSAEELYDAVSAWLSGVEESAWPTVCREQWEKLRPHLVDLLGLDAFAIEARAERLISDRPNWVEGLSVSSDLRPVPDASGVGTSALILIHTLRVRFRHGSSSRVAYFSIDPIDLDILEQQIQQARALGARLTQKDADLKVPILMLASESSSAETVKEGGDE